MNSKIFFLFLCFSFFTGCGVKAKPIVPPEKAIDAYIQSYGVPTDDKKSNVTPTPTPTPTK